MSSDNPDAPSFDEFDEINNPRPAECDFDRVVEAAINRRGFLGGALAFGSFAMLQGPPAFANTETSSGRFTFTQIPANTDDEVTVPDGYIAEVLIRWGDPLWSGSPEFQHATRGTAESQARAFGDNVDGMEVFAIGGRLVLVANNEFTNRRIIWGNREAGNVVADDDINKSKMAHGISIVEIARRGGNWTYIKDSPLNRRITPETPMRITGPAAGHDLLKTTADPTGTETLGTWNNCGNGSTPWGTYLTCEENFNGYFTVTDKERGVSPELQRYSVGHRDWGYGWASTDERFDVSKHPNEPNRAGYVVEIDPADPGSTPKKTHRARPFQTRECRGGCQQ